MMAHSRRLCTVAAQLPIYSPLNGIVIVGVKAGCVQVGEAVKKPRKPRKSASRNADAFPESGIEPAMHANWVDPPPTDQAVDMEQLACLAAFHVLKQCRPSRQAS